MQLGVSPLTHKIFAGKSKPNPHGPGMMWVGKKTDVTDEAIKAVFEYMWMKAEKTGFYNIEIPNFGAMSMTRFKKDDEDEPAS